MARRSRASVFFRVGAPVMPAYDAWMPNLLSASDLRESRVVSTHSIRLLRKSHTLLTFGTLMAVVVLTSATAYAQGLGKEPRAAAARTASGSLTITHDGTVVDSLDVHGSLDIKANDVTIRNTRITYGGYHAVRIYPGAVGTRIIDSSVECLRDRTNGIVFGGYTAIRVAVDGCRNDFMGSATNPAVIVDSTVDGRPYTSGSTPTPTVTATSGPTPTPTATSTTSTSTSTSTSTTTSPMASGAWPSPSNTGPRSQPTRTTGNLTSSKTGQIISNTVVNGRLTVRHDNVVVRDVRVNGTGTYMIQVLKKSDGTCPKNVRFEYTEIDGSRAAENDIPLYSPDCGYTFDRGYVHNVGRTSRLTHDTTISNSYIFSSRTGNSGAHRGAVGTNGGTNNRIINNVLMCEGVGCSAAIPMYGDFAPVNGLLVQHNLLATTGSYCAYGGSVDSKPYPNGSNIRFIDNHFSTRYYPTCGHYGPITGFDAGVRGNQWSGNVWNESGRAIPAP